MRLLHRHPEGFDPAAAWIQESESVRQDSRLFRQIVALDCETAGDLDLDPAEELQVWACSWKEWQERLRSGEVHHALVLSAFLMLSHWDGWTGLKQRLEA